MVAYALRYAEHEIPHGSFRRRMAMYQPSPARARVPRPSQATRIAGDPRRRLLRAKERVSLAHATLRVSAVEDRLRLVQEVAHRWYLGATKRRAARAPAGEVGQGPPAQCGHSGLTDGQDHRRG